jgi:hypothetical protein
LTTDFRCTKAGLVFRKSRSAICEITFWEPDGDIIRLEKCGQLIAGEQFIGSEESNGGDLKPVIATTLGAAEGDKAGLKFGVDVG